MAMTYKFKFRFNAKLNSGMIVNEMDIPVSYFMGGWNNVGVNSANDEAIMLQMETARRKKKITLYLTQGQNGALERKIVSELWDLLLLGDPFFASFATIKYVSGKRIEMYILRDVAATFEGTPHYESGGKKSYYQVDLKLPSPELLTGVQEGGDYEFKKV